MSRKLWTIGITGLLLAVLFWYEQREIHALTGAASQATQEIIAAIRTGDVIIFFSAIIYSLHILVVNYYSVRVPVILLSAKSENTDKIFGLTAGADDYVTKPYDPSELMARVKSQLRRYTTLGSIGKQNGEIVVDGLSVNTETKQVKVEGEEVRLTPVEYKILELMIRNRGRVFSVEDIYQNVWNDQAVVGDNTIAVHVRHIREKIEINPKDPKYLKVVWGIGYKID